MRERQRRHDEVFLVGADLDAETAANLRRDRAHPRRRQTERVGDAVAVPVRRLGRRPDGDAVDQRIGRRHHRARLHRHPRKALRADARLGHDRGIGKRRVDIAVIAIPDALRCCS